MLEPRACSVAAIVPASYPRALPHFGTGGLQCHRRRRCRRLGWCWNLCNCDEEEVWRLPGGNTRGGGGGGWCKILAIFPSEHKRMTGARLAIAGKLQVLVAPVHTSWHDSWSCFLGLAFCLIFLHDVRNWASRNFVTKALWVMIPEKPFVVSCSSPRVRVLCMFQWKSISAMVPSSSFCTFIESGDTDEEVGTSRFLPILIHA